MLRKFRNLVEAVKAAAEGNLNTKPVFNGMTAANIFSSLKANGAIGNGNDLAIMATIMTTLTGLGIEATHMDTFAGEIAQAESAKDHVEYMHAQFLLRREEAIRRLEAEIAEIKGEMNKSQERTAGQVAALNSTLATYREMLDFFKGGAVSQTA